MPACAAGFRGVASALVAACLMMAAAASAEEAWIRGEVRLNVRTGPGTQYRIVDVVKTGDQMTIARRSEGWTEVKLADGKAGWIPAGYLAPEPPPALRLQDLERETSGLRSQLDEARSRAERLAQENEGLSTRDRERETELERLDIENRNLKAGARWPHWITGALILLTGMTIGWVFSKLPGRRATRRIKI